MNEPRYRARVLTQSAGWTEPVLGPDGEHLHGTYPGSGSLITHPLYKHHRAPRGSTIEVTAAELARLHGLGAVQVIDAPDPFTDYTVAVERGEAPQWSDEVQGANDTSDAQESGSEPQADGKQDPGGEDADLTYPYPTGSGWFVLSNGDKVRGQESADKAEAALHEGE